MKGIAIIVCLVMGLIFAGCGPSKRTIIASGTSPTGNNNTSNNTGTSNHFSTVQSAGGKHTMLVQNGHSNGPGLVYWHQPQGVSGNNATVRVTVFFGQFASDNNTLQPGQQPYLWPNYADGAEAGRGPTDYQPIALTEVAGSNRLLWETTLTKFPTNGKFVFTVTRNGGNQADMSANTFATGLQNDSSFDASRQSLQARFENNTIILPTPPI